MASYSGDINGTYGQSSATAPLYISSNCASYCQSCTNSMVGSHWGSQGLLGWISSSWSEADDAASKFAYSNSYGGTGNENGQLFPKGAFLELIRCLHLHFRKEAGRHAQACCGTTRVMSSLPWLHKH